MAVSCKTADFESNTPGCNTQQPMYLFQTCKVCDCPVGAFAAHVQLQLQTPMGYVRRAHVHARSRRKGSLAFSCVVPRAKALRPEG